MRYLALAILAMFIGLLAAPAGVQGLQVSIAPSTMDLGDMVPGDSKYIEFFVVSDHDQGLLVDLNKKGVFRSFFNPDKGRWRYNFVAEEASEEDISGWLTLMDSSIVVPPEQQLQYLEQGGAAYANKKAGFFIEVPADAEPGYHAGVISPYPKTGAQGSGTGLGIIQVAEMTYVVNVLGDAKRDAEIIDVKVSRETPGLAKLNIFIKNKGTVTVSVIADDVEISGRGIEKNLKSGEVVIEPGSVGNAQVPFSITDMEGKYAVDVHAEWSTGEDWFSGSIDIGDNLPTISEITGQAGAPPVAGTALPLWIIPVLVAIIGGAVFWRTR